MASPYARARSTDIIKSSLRSWFKESFKIGDEDEISIIIMHRNNNPKFKQLLEDAKEKYKQLPIRSEEVIVTPDWEVPDSISIFTDFDVVSLSSKSIIKESDKKKLFVKKNKNGELELSKPERQFINNLESTDDELQWWFKNSYGESKYFSIAYKKANGHYYSFYPDFILKTKKETIIVEIKDDQDFKAENALKLRAGQDYIKKHPHKENIKFYILSPDDYDSFFQLLKDQNLYGFKSIYEEQLLGVNKSNQLLLENKKDKSEKETIELELLDELDKTIDELKDTKLKNELLQLSLQQAEENLKAIGKTSIVTKNENEEIINIPIPFHICVLGEVSDGNKIIQDLQLFFTKHGVSTNDWGIKFINNTKIQNTDVLRSFIKGQSKFNLIITGQIHHHSGKGNKKANIVSELKNEKYIPHIIGCDPTSLLTSIKVLESINFFLHD